METGFICIPTHLSKMSEDGVLIRDGCLFDIMAGGGDIYSEEGAYSKK